MMVLMAGMDLPLPRSASRSLRRCDIIVQQTRFRMRLAQDHQHHRGHRHGKRRLQMQEIFRFNHSGYGADGKVRGNFVGLRPRADILRRAARTRARPRPGDLPCGSSGIEGDAMIDAPIVLSVILALAIMLLRVVGSRDRRCRSGQLSAHIHRACPLQPARALPLHRSGAAVRAEHGCDADGGRGRVAADEELAGCVGLALAAGFVPWWAFRWMRCSPAAENRGPTARCAADAWRAA